MFQQLVCLRGALYVLPCMHMQVYICWTSVRNYSNCHHSLLDEIAQVSLLTHRLILFVRFFFRNVIVYHSNTLTVLFIPLYSLWQVHSLCVTDSHCYTYSVFVTALIHLTCSI